MVGTVKPDVRERILDAAGRLFYARGVRAVGMQEIIDEAGTGKSGLYGHFATKDDLVEAYLERWSTALAASADRALREAGEDPGDRIVAAVTHVGQRVLREGGRGCPLRNYLVEFPGSGDEAGAETGPSALARRRLRESRSAVDRAARELAGPVDGPVLAEQVRLVVDGLFARAARRSPGDDAPPVDAVLAALEMVRTMVAHHRGRS